MILGDERFFSREHFEAHKGVAPPHLCELVVYCLELVSQLAHSGLAFRFKGGNCQLILLEDPQRFSIDVDIVTTVSKDHLAGVVEKIAEDCAVFSHCDVRPHKTKPWLPMISFRLYFDSCYQGTEDAYVMLDAVLEDPPYGGTRKRVRCADLYESNETVELPTISGLLADKLLCIGPSTLGIPLGKQKEAQRLKHVFDVSTLLLHVSDTAGVRGNLEACLRQENELQQSSWTVSEVVSDTAKFCSEPLEHAKRPAEAELRPGTYLDEIVRGFDAFREHLFRARYTWGRFQDDCRSILTLLEEIEARA
jgi:hypothetical protein